MTRSSYWLRTLFHTLAGGGIGVFLGLVAGAVFMFLAFSRTGVPRSEVVPAWVVGPLLFVWLAVLSAVLGGALGALIGYLLPVSGGPPFFSAQLPLKFAFLVLIVAPIYLGLVRPRIVRQRNDQDMLHAMWKGDRSAVHRSIEQGANVNMTVGDGTALSAAAQRGDADLCRYLLSQGADINRKNMQGATAMVIALDYGHPEAAQALIEAGADINLADANGQTPLILAARLDNTKPLETLLSKGVQINYVITYGSYSPLITAIMYRKRTNVDLLLQAGADPNLAPQGSPSPLARARQSGDQAIIDLLTAQGAR
jgi:hypothetical protein